MRRREFLSWTGLAGGALGLSALGIPFGAAHAATEYTMVAIPKLRSPWFNRFEVGIEKAGKDFGVDSFQQAPESADEALQVRLINDAVNQGINGLLVVPNDANSLVPAFKRAQAQGIPVITHESPQQPDADFDIEMIDNLAFGAKCMDLLASAIGPEGGKIAIFVGSLTVPAHQIWSKGALDRAAEAYPNIVQLGERYPVSEDQSKSRQTALDIITANPDIKGFLCFGSQGAPGAAQAIEERGLSGKVSAVGTTAPQQASQYIKRGALTGCVLWDPAEAAYGMVYMAKTILEGNRDQITADFDIPTLGKPSKFDGNTLIYDRPLVITADNIDDYMTF